MTKKAEHLDEEIKAQQKTYDELFQKHSKLQETSDRDVLSLRTKVTTLTTNNKALQTQIAQLKKQIPKPSKITKQDEKSSEGLKIM